MPDLHIGNPDQVSSKRKVRSAPMDFKNYSNTELIKFIAENPPNSPDDPVWNAAWAEFYNRFHGFIIAVIRKILWGTKYYHDAEDVAQEVYRILLKNKSQAMKNFRGEHENAAFEWLKIITRREAIRYLKTQRFRETWDDITEVLERLELPGELKSDRGFMELIEEIEDCLKKLTRQSRHGKRDRLIFRLRYYKDLLPEEIARHLSNISEKRVWGILTGLRAGTQDCLSDRLK
jgi:RNA polymerase sigma factor (sigma-70 family)